MLKLVVIKTSKLHKLKAFYELLGLKFNLEKHGKGPTHYSCILKNEVVFEIYPLKVSKEVEINTRLGFEVENIASVLEEVKNKGCEIVSEVKNSAWGKRAVVKDIDGRSIEIYEG